MVGMTITEEAVEATAKGLARHKWPTAIGVWESFGQGMKDDFRDQARAALEAALPHLLAGPHPTMSSEFTAANHAHIAFCPQCQITFG